MRTSNYRKKTEINGKTIKIIGVSAAAVLLCAVVFFFSYFHVSKVEVMGSEHYSDKEIKKMILKQPFASNSILAPIFCTRSNTDDITYVDGLKVSRSNRNTLVISVREKKIVGCIPYLDSYIYFDRNGIFVDGQMTRDESIPFFDGIQVKKVVRDEKLPIKNTVLNTAVALSTIFSKNDMIPDHIQFDDSYEISLLYGDITVYLGKDVYLEDKMTRAIAILPQISGEKGILHMENITDMVKTVTFEAEEEVVTAENWTGGYDENGDYTGDGEYDESGKYVGAKPKSALDYATENWVGGYDEDGDYTGAGEYDADGNYVGEAPTQETIDAFGDWNGGYNESGGFDGVSEYDKDGNYVGPQTSDGSSETDSTEEDTEDSSYDESSYDTEEDTSYSEEDTGEYDDSYDSEYDYSEE